MVSQDLLEILRCPYCVSGETRRPGDDPGRLQLINNVWLVCTEAGAVVGEARGAELVTLSHDERRAPFAAATPALLEEFLAAAAQ